MSDQDKATQETKTKYEVTSLLRHDGKRYEAGSSVMLTDAQAAPLLGRAIKEIEAKASAKK